MLAIRLFSAGSYQSGFLLSPWGLPKDALMH